MDVREPEFWPWDGTLSWSRFRISASVGAEARGAQFHPEAEARGRVFLLDRLSDMEFLEVLTEHLDRVMLVRGGGREVITIYS